MLTVKIMLCCGNKNGDVNDDWLELILSELMHYSYRSTNGYEIHGRGHCRGMQDAIFQNFICMVSLVDGSETVRSCLVQDGLFTGSAICIIQRIKTSGQGLR